LQSSEVLWLFFRSIFGLCDAHTKKIPSWIFWINPKKQKALVDGFLAGDGSISNGICSLVTVSRELAEGLQFLLLRNGILSGIYKHEYDPESRISIKGCPYQIKGCGYFYQVRYTEKKKQFGHGYVYNNMAILRIKGIEEVKNNDSVFALKVKDDETYYSSYLMNHNCSHILEHIKNYEQLMCETYRVLKIGGRLIIKVPYAFCRAAIADPTHVRQFVPESFFHFLPENLGPVANPKFWGTFKIIDLEVIKHDRPEIDRGEVGAYLTEIYCEMEKIPKQKPLKPNWTIRQENEQRQSNHI